MNDILIGNVIKELRAKSYYINGKMVCEVIELYLKIESDDWYKIVISDGISEIVRETEEPFLINIQEINDEFAYPIYKINRPQLLGKIINIQEYLYKGIKNESIGFLYTWKDVQDLVLSKLWKMNVVRL